MLPASRVGRLCSLVAATCLLVLSQLIHPSLSPSQPLGDIFSSQGEYDNFAVGGAHRWYDAHSPALKQKSSHCLSILEEAKAIQDTALALREAAKQPGIDGRQASAFRKQANEQFARRGVKIRAFIDCFNQANRQKSPPSDQFATGGDAPRGDNPQPQPVTKSSPPRKRADNDQKQLPDPAQKPHRNDPGKQSDVFSTKEDTTPSDETQTQSTSEPSHGSGSDELRTGQLPKEKTPSDLFKTHSDDSDCLPQIDSHVLVRLEAERNDILKDLAGGGYITELTLKTQAKLLAAHLHHLTEPNEGLLSQTTRAAKRSLDRAPEAVVQAGRALAHYFTNDTAANHRYLYGQVEKTVHEAEKAIRKKLQNPHITIAEIADSFLVGKATGAICHWTNIKIAKFEKKADQAEQAGKRLRAIEDMKPPGSSSCGPKREDCFWRTLQNATGDPSYLVRKELPTWEEVYDKLKHHFGGAKAKDPLTGRPGDLQKIAEGRPVPVTTDEFVKVLNRMPNNSEGMVFIGREDGSSHVLNLAKFAGSHLFWDDQVRSSNMDILFAGAKTIKWFRYK